MRPFNRLSRPLYALMLLMALAAFGVSAQDNPRALQPNVPVEGAISAANPAQVYTFVMPADAAANLTVESEAGLALTLLVTDATGELVAQAIDTSASGRISLNGIPVRAPGLQYVTVFPAAGFTENANGAFTITLTFSGGLAVTTEATAATPDASATTPEAPATETAATPEATPAVIDFSSGQVLTSSGVQVNLSWGNTSDMNLQVRDPVGQTLFFDSRQTNNGGSFGFDVNGLCEIKTADNPTETATYAPGAVPTGSYEILVYYRQDCDNVGSTSFTLNVTVDGQALEPLTAQLPAPINNQSSVYIASFRINTDGIAEWRTQGPYQDTRTLPRAPQEFLAEGAQPVTVDTPITSVLTTHQWYQLYSFTGQPGDVFSISATAGEGNLDTLILIFNSAGQIVADNDDIATGTNTNSLVSPFSVLAADTYTALVTRYGKDVGGTEGRYEFIVSSDQTAAIPPEIANLNLTEGDIQAVLIWNTNADLQLLVRDPAGAPVYDDKPTAPSGGTLSLAGNRNCSVFSESGTAVSYVYWPLGTLRGGSYETEVWYQNQCNDTRPVTFTLTILVRGQPIFSQSSALSPNQKFVTSFVIDAQNNAIPGPGGIVGGSETLSFSADDVAAAPEIISGQTQRGNITADAKYFLYVFEGTAGQEVDINMRRTQGSLDTNLFLISPSGFEVAANDDFRPGETTDSAIADFTLPETGRYVVIATHFATIYGGTTGSFELNLLINGE